MAKLLLRITIESSIITLEIAFKMRKLEGNQKETIIASLVFIYIESGIPKCNKWEIIMTHSDGKINGKIFLN